MLSRHESDFSESVTMATSTADAATMIGEDKRRSSSVRRLRRDLVLTSRDEGLCDVAGAVWAANLN